MLKLKAKLEECQEAAYGYDPKNRKIDIYVNGEYVASTNWAKTLKDAKEKYLEKNPGVKPEDVSCVFEKK